LSPVAICSPPDVDFPGEVCASRDSGGDRRAGLV